MVPAPSAASHAPSAVFLKNLLASAPSAACLEPSAAWSDPALTVDF
ncbi:hypothetical protein A2U01_0065034 [Trifolium medium]|uniref:Uncharacterized protein n=1 Tax=Trifolium medium TaxID=97028 RepID=A0A392S7D4_9FABA|nr:hypothetical protein [Trifolium medium]